MIEAFAARATTLGTTQPSSLEPERLPKNCATAALHPDQVRAWIGYTGRVRGGSEMAYSAHRASVPLQRLAGSARRGMLSAAEPTLQVGAVDDAEHQDHVVALDDVIHHTVVADTQSVERVFGPTDGLHRLAWYASGMGDVTSESGEGATDAIPVCGIELLESPRGRTGEPDLVGAQSRSTSLTARPLA